LVHNTTNVTEQGYIALNGAEVFLNQYSPTGVSDILDLKPLASQACQPGSGMIVAGLWSYFGEEYYNYPGTNVGWMDIGSAYNSPTSGATYGGVNGAVQLNSWANQYQFTVSSGCQVTWSLTPSSTTLQGYVVQSGSSLEIIMMQVSPTGITNFVDLKPEA